MATTRKKKDSGTLSGLPKDYPYVTIGTHLTVTEYEDGRTELVWDDEVLLREVQDAIKAHEAAELVGSIALGNKPSTRTRVKKNV